MGEALMQRFPEATVRFLFRMQIIDESGQPVQAAPQPSRAVPPAPPVASAVIDAAPAPRELAAASIPVPTRAPQTTIDALEKEFARKKERELKAAQMAGGSAASAPSQRRTGEKVGRNDPCPCGSGKKYKKCHGVEA